VERISAYCQAQGITYIDTLEAFRARHKELGRWLHYRKDAHPTPEGHQVIAETILKSGMIGPVKISATK
jgi:phospholipase/lecithinase/hemolysin